MLYCKKCRMYVEGHKERCPLCQGELSGENPSPEPYPKLAQDKFGRSALQKIINFATIVAAVITLALNLMFPLESFSSLFAIAGVASIWVTLTIGITYRKRLFKNITFQLFFITAACVLWDVATGWRGWSIDFVLPCACVAYMFSIFILSKIIKGPQNSYIIYLVLDAVYGIVPLILLLSGVLKVIYPSVICFACSLISIFGLLIFDGKSLKEEVTRKLHI